MGSQARTNSIDYCRLYSQFAQAFFGIKRAAAYVAIAILPGTQASTSITKNLESSSSPVAHGATTGRLILVKYALPTPPLANRPSHG